jgi:hypothetical protein
MYQLIWTPENGEPEVVETSASQFPAWQMTHSIIQKVCPGASVPFLNGHQGRLGIEYYYLEKATTPAFLEGGEKSITKVFHVEAAGWLLAGRTTPIGSMMLEGPVEEVLPEIDLTLDLPKRAALVVPAVTIEEDLRATLGKMQGQIESLSRAIDQLSMRQMNESALSSQCDLFLRIEELEKKAHVREQKKNLRLARRKEEDCDARLADDIKNFDMGSLRHVVDRY